MLDSVGVSLLNQVLLEFGWARSGMRKNSVDSVQKKANQHKYICILAVRVLRIPQIAAVTSAVFPRMFHS